jgi:TolA-binding protein
MTGFAKFFIFLLFAAPLAYIGASYYNGQDPLETIKSLKIFQKNDTRTEIREDKKTDNASLIKELELKDLEIKQLNEKITKLEEIIETQKKELGEIKSKKVN